nr:hypothetical protein CFP56_03953 [Quercus suber]
MERYVPSELLLSQLLLLTLLLLVILLLDVPDRYVAQERVEARSLTLSQLQRSERMVRMQSVASQALVS